MCIQKTAKIQLKQLIWNFKEKCILFPLFCMLSDFKKVNDKRKGFWAQWPRDLEIIYEELEKLQIGSLKKKKKA